MSKRERGVPPPPNVYTFPENAKAKANKPQTPPSTPCLHLPEWPREREGQSDQAADATVGTFPETQ